MALLFTKVQSNNSSNYNAVFQKNRYDFNKNSTVLALILMPPLKVYHKDFDETYCNF